jgi:hypothetical protein
MADYPKLPSANKLTGDEMVRVRQDGQLKLAKAQDVANLALPVKTYRLAGTLSFAAGTIAAGIPTRTIAVAGLLPTDGIAVTPKAALPAGLVIGQAICLKAGELTLTLSVPLLITLAKTDVPLIVTVFR